MSSAREYLQRIEQKDSDFNSFLYVNKQIEDNDRNLTVAVKDNILIKDWSTTAASKVLEGFVAPYDATVIKRLKKENIQFIGKTNLDEFAMGGSTENSTYKITKNPWNTERVPGGSSGGSAVAVAADFCDVALGSDTGGSIRQPAAFCGVTGLKPTYGGVSRYGLISMASSLDVIGPIARSAQQVEKVFSIIAGKDEHDQTTIDYHYEQIDQDLSKLKVGLPKEFWELDKMDPEVRNKVQNFVDWLREKGADVKPVSLPSVLYSVAAYYIIVPAEVMANMERYDGIRYQKSLPGKTLIDQYKNTRALLGPEVKRRILLGTYVLSVGHYDDYYQLAVKARRQIAKEFTDAFEEVDLLISPVTLTTPYKLGTTIHNPLAMYQADLLTIPANLAGVPALSVPVGFNKEDLPIGAQLMAAHKKDNLLLSVAKQYQQATDWHKRRATL